METRFLLRLRDHHVLFGLVIWATLVLPSLSISVRSCSFPAMFNFGDSNSDTGGLSAAFGQAPYPNGETYFHTPSGRYSDGRLLIDFIGEVFGKLLPKKDYFSQALYTFDIGQNDLTAGYKLNLTTEQVKAYVPDVLSQLSHTIKIVYEQGGRSFWIHNTGPLGCLPYVLDRFLINPAQIDKYGCADQFNEVAQYFNQRLKEALLHLKKDLPLAAITYVDLHPYHPNQKIWYAKCGTKKTINGNETVIAKSCNDPTVRINWDGVHYTEAANKWIFQQIVNGSFSDPPNPLKMACRRSRMDH